MNILIAYSSGLGSTKEVSEKIGQVLKIHPSVKVDVQSIDDAVDIEQYETVIIGSTVRADRPLANVRDFFARHRFSLPNKKVALFAVCLSANCHSGQQKVKDEYLSQITEKYPKIDVVSLAAFGGKINFDQLNPVMQLLMKKVLAKTGIPTVGSVDTRDWEYITSWAESLKHILKLDEMKNES
jgi:menaquinone-dependent protoporphyrinogen oxidase